MVAFHQVANIINADEDVLQDLDDTEREDRLVLLLVFVAPFAFVLVVGFAVSGRHL